MIQRVTRDELFRIVSHDIDVVSEHDRDEMAIPSYLHWNPLIRWLMWRRYEKVAQLADIRPSDTAFEFGCGTGVFLPELSRRAKRVCATDLFPQFAKRLVKARSLNVDFVAGLDDVADDSLDVIIAADVLEHIEDLAPYLVLFSKKLRSSGRLVVSGPTENVVYKLGRILAGFAGKGHYHHTNIGHLVRAIRDFGFQPTGEQDLPFALPPHLFKVAAFAPPPRS